MKMLKKRITEAIECVIPDILIRLRQKIKYRFEILVCAHVQTLDTNIKIIYELSMI